MDSKIIELLLCEAEKAFNENEVPIGCVITKNMNIVCSTHNTKMQNNCSINHAEMNAITIASKIIGDWRLDDCELYVTLEPCNMCKEAIRQARIKKVYYLLPSNFHNEDKKKIDYNSITINNDAQRKYKMLLQQFFSNKR